jgi:hypothetical protein
VRPPCLGARATPATAGGPRSVAIFGPGGRVLALGEVAPDASGPVARPHVVFPWASRQGRP